MSTLQLTQKGFEAQNFTITPQAVPSYEDDQVLIKLEATGLNPIDWKMAATGLFLSTFPAVLGCDGSGTIEAVGKAVTTFKKGDRVFFYPGLGPNGTFASYRAVDARLVGKLPASLSFEQGAALPVAAETAALAFFLNLKGDDAQYKGKPFLVYGASSTVGLFAVQIASAYDRKVIAVASQRNHSLIKSYGATELLDYKDSDWKQKAKSFGVSQIFDAIGGEQVLTDLLEILAPNGAIASTDPVSTGKVAKTEGKTAAPVVLGGVPASPPVTDKVVEFIPILSSNLEKGVWKPLPVRVLPGGLKDVFQGLKDLQEGKVSAEKLVVKLSDTN